MKRLLPVLLLLVAGCVQPAPQPVAPTPDKPTPVTTSTPETFFEALAQWVESGGCATTDEFFAVGLRAAEARKIDRTLFDREWPTVPPNKPLDEPAKSELAAKCRRLKVP